MAVFKEAYEDVFMTMTGNLIPEARVPWVEDAMVPGADYYELRQRLFRIRDTLSREFDLDQDSGILWDLFASTLDLEKAVARRMFQYGVEYARRGEKL